MSQLTITGGPAFGICRRNASGLALLCLLIGAWPAHAETTARDLQTIARALAFLEPAPSGLVELGIVYPVGSIDGRAEAERSATAMRDGLRAGAIQLRGRPMTLDEAASAPPAALLLTEAALPQGDRLAALLAGRGVPTISTNPSAVASDKAVMAVRAEPRVEIIVSRAAARVAGVAFSAAFRMMIQER